MRHIGPHSGPQAPTLYNVASVFVQKETGHLLISNVDAGVKDVRESGRNNWSRLFFNHQRISSTRPDYLTILDISGQQSLTAAPMSSHCVPRLIPKVYDASAPSARDNAGVTGKLPLLIALAALSEPKHNVVDVLTRSLAPGRWRPHQYRLERSKFKSPFPRFFLDSRIRRGISWCCRQHML